ncbi:MAG: rhomboid family intramembrane serine protease [Burkholderiales bacterium]|nr:rhomboid family intramembrane serine protease [Burkholderiales bacterium]
MLLPISDYPNPRGMPWMTVALVAANVLVYALVTLPLSAQRPDPQDPLLYAYLHAISDTLPPGVTLLDVARQTTLYDLFTFQFGFRPAQMSVLTLFTSMFMHGSLMHVFGNMLFLWIYGNNVEHRLGWAAFLFWYLACGAAAAAFQAVFNLHSQIPMVGASGAISGVLGFYFVWFPRYTVRLFVFLFPFYIGTIHVPARIVLAIFLLLDNLLPFLLTTGMGGIAHGAHIGGFVAGVAAALAMRRPPPERDLLE